LSLTARSIAQSVTVPVTIPVHGQLTISGTSSGTIVGPGNNQLLLVDTYDGGVDILMQSDRGTLTPVWRSDGNALAFLNVPAISVYDVAAQSFQDISAVPDQFSFPQAWSPDSSELLNISYSLSNGVGQYQLQRVNVSDGAITPLFIHG
jgi:hypothetical protein